MCLDTTVNSEKFRSVAKIGCDEEDFIIITCTDGKTNIYRTLDCSNVEPCGIFSYKQHVSRAPPLTLDYFSQCKKEEWSLVITFLELVQVSGFHSFQSTWYFFLAIIR
mmetsp:Transcript_412/g.495  ORF Transcript_412/g.495 Transcript_412/m.495 type:complete len:108 (+) Transcript_412:295-618(+)